MVPQDALAPDIDKRFELGTVHGPVAATLMIAVRLCWAVEPHGDLNDIDHHGMHHTLRRMDANELSMQSDRHMIVGQSNCCGSMANSCVNRV
eukprot:3598410-Amphidinium_carterae.1